MKSGFADSVGIPLDGVSLIVQLIKKQALSQVRRFVWKSLNIVEYGTTTEHSLAGNILCSYLVYFYNVEMKRSPLLPMFFCERFYL